MQFKKATLTIFLATPESQESLEEAVSKLQSEIKSAKFHVEIVSKKLTPFDVVITLTVQVAAKLLYDLIQRIVREVSDKKIAAKLDYNSRQAVAESFLLKNGIEHFRLEGQSDLPDISTFTYRDRRGQAHRLQISSDGACKYSARKKRA